MRRLKTALIGLSGVGAGYLDALLADDQFELIAVGDTDRGVLRHRAEALTARAYQDYRSLIVESARNGVDSLFVAAEPFQAREHVDLAMAHGVAVFHKAPPARNVNEARHLADSARRAAVPLIVSRPWAFEPALTRLHGLAKVAGRIHAVHAEVRTSDRFDGWRADARQAGGGVLLNGAYQALDMIVALCGPARSVFARCGRGATPEPAAKYDTEDVAHLSLTLANGAIGCLSAVRGTTDCGWRLTLDGDSATVTVSHQAIRITPRDRGREESVPFPEGRGARRAISAFGAARLAGLRSIPSSIRDHAATLAVIGAAYLSAKTGVPETPDESAERRTTGAR